MTVQDTLSLHDAKTAAPRQGPRPWRPIHYLGSKLRMLEPIETALQDLRPDYSRVCDLFAGSGTVASQLAREKNVTAVDIQEYSRVICSALLKPVEIDREYLNGQLRNAIHESERSGLLWATLPLIEFEESAIAQAEHGDLRELCDLLELGPLAAALWAQRSAIQSEKIERILVEVRRRMSGLSNLKESSTALLNFGGLYFSFKQAIGLDLCLSLVDSNKRQASDTIIAAVLSTASVIVNTVGKQFAQPIRPRDKNGNYKRNLSGLVQRDRHKDVFSQFLVALEAYELNSSIATENNVVRSDFREFLAGAGGETDIVYADPPYTRDHYSRFYHVLETLALRDSPSISTNKTRGVVLPSRGAYRTDRHQSPFCIRSEAPKAFEELFALISASRVPLVLSYSPYASEKNAHPRVLSLKTIEEISKKFFRRTTLRSAGEFSHSRLNRVGLNKEISYEAEYLFLMEP